MAGVLNYGVDVADQVSGMEQSIRYRRLNESGVLYHATGNTLSGMS